MAKVGRKKKTYLSDFREQQNVLFQRHSCGIPLTQDECSFLVNKHGEVPLTNEERVTKMTVCKWEKEALGKMRVAICNAYPNWSEKQIRDAFLDIVAHRECAKEAGSPEAKSGIMW